MTDTARSRPRIRRPLGRRLIELARRGALGCVWVAAAVGAWLLYQSSPEQQSVKAVAETVEHHLGTATTARIADVPVAVGETVRAGDLVVVLDGTTITRQLAVLSAELEQRNAELTAQAAAMGRERLSEERSFAAEVDAAEVALLEARVERDAVRAELAGVRAQERRQRSLVSQRVTAREELDRLEAERQVLAKRARVLEDAVEGLEAHLAETRERLDAFRAAAPPVEDGDDPEMQAALAPARAAIEVARAQLAELEALREELFIRAPSDGIVHRVLLRPGDVAPPGEPIVVLRARAPHRVLAYIDDARAQELHVGSPVAILDRTGSRLARNGRVASMGAGLAPYPEQLQTSQNRVLWGREIVIELEPGGDEVTELVPGQVLDVRFVPEEPGATDPAVAAAGGAATATAPRDDRPRPVAVPPALRRQTRIEPSGLVWSGAHARFLVASDDTGYPDAADHAPWLLLMNDGGSFAPTPLVVQGLRKLNDVESLAWLDDGRLLLLSSQSTSKRGRRPRSRTLLVAASVDGVRLRATAEVSLAEAMLAALSPAELRALGLRPAGPALDPRLDIEGMAVVDGALLLGLKEPLGEGGCALVWRLRDAASLLDSGRLAPGQLERFACLPLRTEGDDGVAVGGVSDLAALPDGGLLVLSSDVPPPDHPRDAPDPAPAGTLWRLSSSSLSAGGAELRPQLVRRFDGARPEGVALGADGHEIVVVFDRGSDTPLWTSVPATSAGRRADASRDTVAAH